MPWSNPLPKLLDLSMSNMTLGIFDIIRSYYIPACCAFKDYAQNDAIFAQNNGLFKARISYNIIKSAQ
jgi:hypothetical protein